MGRATTFDARYDAQAPKRNRLMPCHAVDTDRAMLVRFGGCGSLGALCAAGGASRVQKHFLWLSFSSSGCARPWHARPGCARLSSHTVLGAYCIQVNRESKLVLSYDPADRAEYLKGFR